MNAETAIASFIQAYPSMSLKPSSSSNYIIEGDFAVFAQYGDNRETLVDRVFALRIEVPTDYPNAIPIVYEVGDSPQIPKLADYHKNDDDSLCLGAPFTLLSLLQQDASLVGFAKNCIIPHLTSAILKKEKGIPFSQGELKHYDEGLEQEFSEFFGLNLSRAVIALTFQQLGEKKRKANKRPCPCGKGLRLGSCACAVHRLICRERKTKRRSRSFFRNVAKYYVNSDRNIKSLAGVSSH